MKWTTSEWVKEQFNKYSGRIEEVFAKKTDIPSGVSGIALTNNLDAIEPGTALDAVQGKVLKDGQDVLETKFASFEEAKDEMTGSVLGGRLGLGESSSIAEVASAFAECTYDADTSDGDAGAGNLVFGKIAYANGRRIVGNVRSYPDGYTVDSSKPNSVGVNMLNAPIFVGGRIIVNGYPNWLNAENGSYCFAQSGIRWIANNRGVNSSTATSTWTVTVPEATTAYIGYRVASESNYDKLTIAFNGSNIVSAVSGNQSQETVLTLSLVAGENTLVATYTKDNSNSSNGDMAYVVLPLIGDQPGQYKYQSKSVTPSTSLQTVTPDTGYDGLYSVSVSAAPASSGGITGVQEGNGTRIADTKTTVYGTSEYKMYMVTGVTSNLTNYITLIGNATMIPAAGAKWAPYGGPLGGYTTYHAIVKTPSTSDGFKFNTAGTFFYSGMKTS